MPHKSGKLLQECIENGWQAQVKLSEPIPQNPEEIVWNLYAIRGKETLHVQWVGNRMQPATYTHGEAQRLTLYWRNQVVKKVTGKPDLTKLKGEDTDRLIETRYVPFDADTPADKVLAEVRGCEITWIRTLDNLICKATIPAHLEAKHLRVKECNSGKRILEWADPYGFHAVHLDRIINVS